MDGGRKNALILEITQEEMTVSEAYRPFALVPSEIDEWIERGMAWIENALRAKP